MTIDEQRYLLNQDCLLMKYQRGNAMNEPLQIFRGKWADGLERLHQIIDKEVGWKNFRSFVSSNVHHDSETSIEVVKKHKNITILIYLRILFQAPIALTPTIAPIESSRTSTAFPLRVPNRN